jgi:thioredoxin 1
MSATVIHTSSDFENAINSSLCVVDFFADWCGPCRSMSPIFDDFASKFKGKVNVVKVNIDSLPDIATRLSVMSIPTLIMFKNGAEISRHIGVLNLQGLERWIATSGDINV